MNITVLGMGSWGTALAVLLANKGYEVTQWGREEDLAFVDEQKRENPRYLPGVRLPDTMSFTADLTQAMSDTKAVVMVVPSTAVRQVSSAVRGLLNPDMLLVHAGKGLESSTGLRGSQIIGQELGDDIGGKCVALSGPNLAVELAHNVPTATVVASQDHSRAVQAQELFASPSLRVYSNPDIAGVELGGALKNVFAIGAGISDGLGYGDNTKATVVTRGLAEMTRIGVALGAQARTFTGLAGIGDLMATSASRLSRNLRLGTMIGQGKSLQESLDSLGQVAEGIHSCQAAYKLSKELDIYAPITEQVHAILFEGKSPKQAVAELMTRTQKDELY